ncbi:hypothetical protein [Pontibacter fetidus]|uniref:Uncharacterized protein n=1 Tax=Pontibacter fetidus TaxID=2700082 RepID=A0A6B2H1A3_9BACT|nr:hypothetical protein [Pontibacter fetidus]NDK56083.1 hypothetical protein [Pontibacter fetidus]
MEKVIAQPVQSSTTIAPEVNVFYRITALWAISESFLGGILHALHLPGTGLFVGGASVLCISLLATHCPDRRAILKATVLVILIKGILSPHTPPGAYLAVFIQGGLGYILFQSRRYFKLSCLLLGVLTQLQSALQRLVVMFFIFGADLYKVAHEFVNYILQKAGVAEGNYVLYVVIGYIGLHALMGILVGWLAGRLPHMLHNQQQQLKAHITDAIMQDPLTIVTSKKKRPYKRYFSFLFISVAILLAAALYLNVIAYNTAYSIFFRAVLLTSCWVFVAAPLLQAVVRKWSDKKKSILATELSQIVNLMPFIQQQASLCWASTSTIPFYKRLFIFPARLVATLI